MEQTDRAAIRNLVLGVILGIVLSRLTIGSIFMTVPILLACPSVRKANARLLAFAAIALGVTVWTLIDFREAIGTVYWPLILVYLYVPIAVTVGSAVWTVGSGYSRSSMRKFFWACIPVFVMGAMLSMYFASEKSAPVRGWLVDSYLLIFPTESLSMDITSLVQAVVKSLMLFFAPMGLLLLAIPVVISDINLNRYDEDWQYDFANMKLPDTYVWILFASWALALLTNFVTAIPDWIMALMWNVALSLSVLYFVVGVSILVAFARRRTAALTAGRIVLMVALGCIIPVVNMIVLFGLVLLGVLETWIRFR